jgi:hypothetical protein
MKVVRRIRYLSKKYVDPKAFRQFLRMQFRYDVSLVSYIGSLSDSVPQLLASPRPYTDDRL